MSPPAQARTRARTGAREALALAVVLALGCGGDASLDMVGATAGMGTGTGTTGGTLPALDDGSSSSGAETSTGEPTVPDDPRLCPAECPVILPVDWIYEGSASARPSAPGQHLPTTMLRMADGSLIVGEQRDGTASLHRLDRHGALQWHVPLPLPCDVCELTHVSLHPSGDLLLSASGSLLDEELALLAARYDPVRHAAVWVASLPLQSVPDVWVRSGDIVGLADGLVVQLYMAGQADFDIQQITRLVAYDADGSITAEEHLVLGAPTFARPPLLVRTTPSDDLVLGVFDGYEDNLFGRLHQVSPPLWQTQGFTSLPSALDGLVVDDRGHALTLGHAFEGTRTYLLLSDRAGDELEPRWSATLTLPSTTDSPAVLAVGPEGDAYAAVRTTQAPSEHATPLTSLSLARWTTQGELRWSTTLLQDVDDGFHPVELVVDDEGGLVIATVVDDRLRVEHRTQQCGCG